MERLTKKEMLAGHEVHFVSGDDCFDVWSEPKKFMGEAIDRLSAYEDTGLEPEEITDIKHILMRREIANITEFDGIPIKRLQELAQAEKDGRLVVLPCKVGDTVYIIRDKKIIIATVEAIHQWVSGKWKVNVHTDKRYAHWVGYEVSLDDFGKTVFLTREEAEAAMKKEGGGRQ